MNVGGFICKFLYVECLGSIDYLETLSPAHSNRHAEAKWMRQVTSFLTRKAYLPLGSSLLDQIVQLPDFPQVLETVRPAGAFA